MYDTLCQGLGTMESGLFPSKKTVYCVITDK